MKVSLRSLRPYTTKKALEIRKQQFYSQNLWSQPVCVSQGTTMSKWGSPQLLTPLNLRTTDLTLHKLPEPLVHHFAQWEEKQLHLEIKMKAWAEDFDNFQRGRTGAVLESPEKASSERREVSRGKGGGERVGAKGALEFREKLSIPITKVWKSPHSPLLQIHFNRSQSLPLRVQVVHRT